MVEAGKCWARVTEQVADLEGVCDVPSQHHCHCLACEDQRLPYAVPTLLLSARGTGAHDILLRASSQFYSHQHGTCRSPDGIPAPILNAVCRHVQLW